MHINFRGFAHLTLVVIVVIVGIVGLLYFSWQKGLIKTIPKQQVSPIPTTTLNGISEWKTYRNEEYNFEFKYPSEWVNKPVASENTISQFGEYFEGGEPGSSSPQYFYISIEPYETIFAQDIKNDGTEIINQEKVRIENKIYDLYTHKQFEVEATYKIIDYIPIKDTNRADLYLYFSHTVAECSMLPPDAQVECLKENESNNAFYQDIRNQILSTFKILE